VIQLEEFGNWVITERELNKGQLKELLLAAIQSDIRIEELRDIDSQQAKKDRLNWAILRKLQPYISTFKSWFKDQGEDKGEEEASVDNNSEGEGEEEDNDDDLDNIPRERELDSITAI